jgi:catechol 2,3-dioxygenase-like lactoylglutathione lyase family enzyme
MKTAPDGKPARPVYLNRRTFSLIGRLTLDLDKTCDFYRRILEFEPIASETLETEEGIRTQHIVFDIGRNQLIALCESD